MTCYEGINIDFRFEEPRNALWLTGVEAEAAEDKHLAVLTFDSELLAKREGAFSPYLAAWWRFEDYRAFEQDEVLRHNLRTNLWNPLRQLLSHFETGRDDLFDRVSRTRFETTPDGDSRIDRLSLLHDQTGKFLRNFTYEADDVTMAVEERIREAHRVDTKLLQGFAECIVSSGLAAELWRQIHELHSEFMEIWESLSPALNLRYWKKEPADLTEFSVTSKDFGRIRPFYLNCFETISQISVLAIGVEAIAHGRQLSIPARKRSLWVIPDFSELPNANKADHLVKYPPLDKLFAPHMTAEIRNGIGHNSSFHDFESDEVVCVKSSSGAIEETYRENYTLFCRRVLNLVSSISRLEIYLYMLLMLVGGEYRPTGSPTSEVSLAEPLRGVESSARYRSI